MGLKNAFPTSGNGNLNGMDGNGNSYSFLLQQAPTVSDLQNVEIQCGNIETHLKGAGYVAHKSSLIWLFSDLIECDGKKTKPASLTASPAVMVATGSPSTLIASPSTPMALFPPPGMDGVPQPTVSTKELIIIIFMFCLWAYSLFLTYRLSI